jgi:hypothetical protein
MLFQSALIVFRWALCLSAAIPTGLLGQEVYRIPEAVDCAACSVALDTVAILGTPNDAVILMPESRFETLADGSIIAYQTSDPGVLVHYGPEGEFLRAFGREGQGPREFSSLIEGLRVAQGDSLLLLDRDNRRVAVLDPRFETAYTVPINGDLYDVFSLGSGRLLVQGWLPVDEAIGFPLHVVSAESHQTSPVHAARQTGMPPVGIPPTPADVDPKSGLGWLVGWYDYTLTEFDAATGELRRFRREVPWLPPAPTGIRDLNLRAHDPKAIAYDLQIDAEGRVWVALWVEESEGAGSIAPEQPQPNASDRSRRFDTIIEVFDPSLGAVVVSERFDRSFGRFAGPGRISLVTEDRTGYQRWAILSLRLQGLTPHTVRNDGPG